MTIRYYCIKTSGTSHVLTDVDETLVDPVVNATQDVDYATVYEILNGVTFAATDYAMIYKDTTLFVNPEDIDVNLTNIVTENPDFDVMWVANWLDKCEAFSNKIVIPNVGYVANTYAPNGFQCILVSNSGKDKIMAMKPILKDTTSFGAVLSKLTNLNKITVFPPLAFYNVGNAKSHTDYSKLALCIDPPREVRRPVSDNDISLVYFIIIGISTSLVLWLLYKASHKLN